MLFWTYQPRPYNWGYAFDKAIVFKGKPNIQKVLMKAIPYDIDGINAYIRYNNISVIRTDLIPFL